MGFVNLFPVSDEVFAKLKAGEFNDKNLSVDDIVDIGSVLGDLPNEPLHMFLSCIVVVIDNVTKEGRRFSMKYGFEPIGETQHDSMNFIQKYADFCKRVRMMK